uniref:Uncharacterized protein n=1 Tax=Romanomermis culicivorax TaxID=13658 RepID=A0A915K313_ROMCU
SRPLFSSTKTRHRIGVFIEKRNNLFIRVSIRIPRMLYAKKASLVFLFHLLGNVCAKETQCGGRYYTSNDINDVKAYSKVYTCPLGNDRINTDCCDPPTYNCCQPPKSALDIENGLGIVIAVSVIILLLIGTFTMTICCCWEKCPLYMACRKEAKLDYIATMDDAEVLHMPGENTAELKTYDPNKFTTA